MSIDYQTIIDAIDTAILNWADKPVRVSDSHGHDVTYRSLDELIRAREKYVALEIQQNNKRPFSIKKLKAGGIRE